MRPSKNGWRIFIYLTRIMHRFRVHVQNRTVTLFLHYFNIEIIKVKDHYCSEFYIILLFLKHDY